MRLSKLTKQLSDYMCVQITLEKPTALDRTEPI